MDPVVWDLLVAANREVLLLRLLLSACAIALLTGVVLIGALLFERRQRGRPRYARQREVAL